MTKNYENNPWLPFGNFVNLEKSLANLISVGNILTPQKKAGQMYISSETNTSDIVIAETILAQKIEAKLKLMPISTPAALSMTDNGEEEN